MPNLQLTEFPPAFRLVSVGSVVGKSIGYGPNKVTPTEIQSLEGQPRAPMESMVGTEVFAPPREVDGLMPLIIDEFVSKLSGLAEVAAVVAEDGERPGEVHLTTFATEPTPEVRRRVYEAERYIIDKFAPRTFDFHLRRVERSADGQLRLPEAPYCLVFWRRQDR